MKELDKFKSILDEIKRLSKNVKEIENKNLSIFDIGGKGYYENPASDILGFYLSSNCPIYKPILKVFLEFRNDDSNILDISEVKFEREVTTYKGNRIDIIIRGKDWLITIENKIRHYLANDLDDYKNYVNSCYDNPHKYFYLLSNESTNEFTNENWKTIKWSDLLDKFDGLKIEDNEHVKWWYFFKDFVLCLKNEFNGDLTMNEELRKFFDKKENYILSNELIDYRNKYLKNNLEIIRNRFELDADVSPEGNYTYYRLALKNQKVYNRRIEILISLGNNGIWSFNFYLWKYELNSNDKESINEETKNDFKKDLSIESEWQEQKNTIWCFKNKTTYETIEETCNAVKNLIDKINSYFK